MEVEKVKKLKIVVVLLRVLCYNAIHKEGILTMRCFVSVLVLALFGFGANAAQSGRPAVANPRVISAPRYTASVNQLNGMSNAAKTNVVSNNVAKSDEQNVAEPVEEEQTEEDIVVDMREAEREACMNNNIGINNTFVWASKYSDTSNYAMMVEDVEHPENNVCFVRVDLGSSNESRIKVADIEPKYFMWDETIKCGSWVSKKEMEKRILDARKGERVGGIVATTVAGVGLGVGAMELFGNKLIGGKVMGQKSSSVSKTTLYKNRLLKSNDSEQYKEDLKLLFDACEQEVDYIDKDDCNVYKDLNEAINEN